jgi:hypothetical protein
MALLVREAKRHGLDPRPVSGRQELYENIVNRHIWSLNGMTGTATGTENAAD